jgi:hypothetical protein
MGGVVINDGLRPARKFASGFNDYFPHRQNGLGLEHDMRRSVRQSTLLAITVLTGLVLIACPQRTKIGDLTSNPGRYADKEVAITGTVTESFGLLGTGGFQVDDGSGKIWVLSEGFGVPGKGARVGVTGRLAQGVSIGNRGIGTALRQTKKPHY